MATNPYKLITLVADSAEVAKNIQKAMQAIPPQSNNTPIVVTTKVSVRTVKPTDEKVAPFTKHVCQVLSLPAGIAHATMLAAFAGCEVLHVDAPDNAFKTAVTLTDSALGYLTFSEESPVAP